MFSKDLEHCSLQGPRSPCTKFHNCVTRPCMDSKRHSNNAYTRSNSMIASSCASICETRSMPPVQPLCWVTRVVSILLPYNNASNSVVVQPLSSCKKRPAASSNSTALDMPVSLRLHAYPARLAACREADTFAKPVNLDTTLTQAKRSSQNGHGQTYRVCDRRIHLGDEALTRPTSISPFSWSFPSWDGVLWSTQEVPSDNFPGSV